MMILILALFSVAQAAELKISRIDYDAAEKAPVYFKFIGHSRKLGIIGTSFTGYAKEAVLTFDRKGNELQKVGLALPVASLDTDSDARNDKMREKCLSARQFPLVKVNVVGAIDLEKNSQILQAIMEVRGKNVPLSLNIEKTSDGLIKGTTSFKLSEAEIPDPSIAIASVKDEFEIEFQVDVMEKK